VSAALAIGALTMVATSRGMILFMTKFLLAVIMKSCLETNPVEAWTRVPCRPCRWGSSCRGDDNPSAVDSEASCGKETDRFGINAVLFFLDTG